MPMSILTVVNMSKGRVQVSRPLLRRKNLDLHEGAGNQEHQMIRLKYLGILALALLLFLTACTSTGFEEAMKDYEAHRYTKAFQKFIDLGKNGDKRAQFYVGRMLHLGEGVAQDKFAAFLWYRKSAEQEFARAQNNLAVLYLEQDRRDEALVLFQKAATQGLPQARENLSRFNRLGGGTGTRRGQSGGRSSVVPPDMAVHFNRLRAGLQ